MQEPAGKNMCPTIDRQLVVLQLMLSRRNIDVEEACGPIFCRSATAGAVASAALLGRLYGVGVALDSTLKSETVVGAWGSRG